jgi:hypothetical protein
MNSKQELIVVKEVLNQMKLAEDYMNKQGLSWEDKFFDAYSSDLKNIDDIHIKEIERANDNRFNLDNVKKNNIHEPLVTFTLIDDNYDYKNEQKEFEVDFGRVDWYVNKTKGKNKREFSFHNNGIIDFSKTSLAKKGNTISYTTSFDVLTSDFSINVIRTYEDRQDIIDFTLKNNRLLITLNGVGKGLDLETNEEITKSASRDYYDANLCNESRDKAMELISIIKGELPLPGLVDRINFGLSLLSNAKYNSRRK